MNQVVQKVKSFFEEVCSEGRRIAWPERKELIDSTSVVIVFIVILGLVVLSCDKVIQFLLEMIYALAK